MSIEDESPTDDPTPLATSQDFAGNTSDFEANLDNIPDELKALPNWTAYGKPGVKEKAPINPHTCDLAKVSDASTWADFTTAVECSLGYGGRGVGFQLGVNAEDTPYASVDLDGVPLDNEGNPTEQTQEILRHFPTYTELSISGRHLHIVARGRWRDPRTAPKAPKGGEGGEMGDAPASDENPGFTEVSEGHTLSAAPKAPMSPIFSKSHGGGDETEASACEGSERGENGCPWVPGCRNKNKEGDIEVYDHGKVIILTGNLYGGSDGVIRDCQEGLDWLYTTYFQDGQARFAAAEGVTTQVLDEDRLADEEVIRKLSRAKNKAKFKRLYEDGDLKDYGGDASSADFALCSMLAFYTGNNPPQVERLMGQSALGQREKWQTRQDYRQRTIENAIRGKDVFYAPRAKVSHAQMVASFGSAGDYDTLTDAQSFLDRWLAETGVKIEPSGRVESGKDLIPKDVVNQLLLEYDRQKRHYNDTKSDKAPGIYPGIRDSLFRMALEQKYRAVYKEAKAEVLTSIAYQGEDDSELRRFCEAVTDTIRETDVAVVKQFVWQVKRKALGRRVRNHILPVLTGVSGNGKSTAVKRLVSPFHGLGVMELSLSQVVDDRVHVQFERNLIGVLDEMEKAEKVDAESLKRVVTADSLNPRVLHTHDMPTVRQSMTLIGTSNKHLCDLIYDTTSNRRYWEIECPLQSMDHAVINDLDYIKVWSCVDEDNDEGYLVGDLWRQVSEVQASKIQKTPLQVFLEDYGIVGDDDYEGELVEVDRMGFFVLYVHHCSKGEQKAMHKTWFYRKLAEAEGDLRLRYSSLKLREERRGSKRHYFVTLPKDVTEEIRGLTPGGTP